MIRAIIFDCFGVLYLNSSQHFYETHLPNYHELQSELLALSAQSDYGLITPIELREEVSDLTGISTAILHKQLDGLHKRNDVLIDYSQTLRKDYKVGMLSNISVEGMKKFFSDEQREHLFDASLLSGEIGMTKPHPLIFTEMADRLGVLPGDCVMIDDVEENCAGADAAGMKWIHFKSNGQLKCDINMLLTTV